jgi:23S rRNA pseudouridine1911/1915/1917 synthase
VGRTLTFEAAGRGERLDRLIVAQLPELSRTLVQRLIADGEVRVGEAVIRKPAHRLERAAQIVVHLPAPAPSMAVAEDIPLNIVFENDDLIVVNKPAGMVVHPAAGHSRGTLVNAVLGHDPHLEGVGDETRPGIVHRLDKETSGLIVVAKNDAAHHALQKQFADRTVEKVYLALVDGAPPTDTGRIEAAIGRDPNERKRMAIVPHAKGREAVTEYSVRERFDAHTLVECRLLTGRTHQIRLHLAYLKCPIVGDTVYGRRKTSLPLSRHFLHAARLTLTLPGEAGRKTFVAPLPDELERMLQALRR